MSPSGTWGLSYKQVGWDLMSKVTPDVASPDYALEITSADKTPLFCHVIERELPVTQSQIALSSIADQIKLRYTVGAIVDDPTGGSRVVGTSISAANDVRAFRLDLQTLDQRRPILERHNVTFAIKNDAIALLGSVECFVGFGSPPKRWSEIDQVLSSVRIKGAALTPE
jgi:hypothetical protein